MGRRYLFLSSDSNRASGGEAVIHDVVSLLRRHGFDAVLVHGRPSAAYSDYAETLPRLYSYGIRRSWARHPHGLRHFIETSSSIVRDVIFDRGSNDYLETRPDDVIVTPEFIMPEALEAFPNHPVMVFVQNPFAFAHSYVRARQWKIDVRARVTWALGNADVCMKQLELLGFERAVYFPVTPKPDEFPFREKKDKLITFMPRRRPIEARIVEDVLRSRGRIRDYQVMGLDGITRAEVGAHMSKSLIFISLLKEESLGFPAAEAMASGCITVGFTGLGAEEYFDQSTGVPIPEGDLTSLILKVEEIVAEYEADPRRLDELRRTASARINAKYSREAFETRFMEGWRKVVAG